MGQKVHPVSIRLGIVEGWRSRWYASKSQFGSLLVRDQRIRKYFRDNYRFAAISRVEIEGTSDETRVIVYTARPALVIGRKGVEIKKIRTDLQEVTEGTLDVIVQEVPKAELNAQLIADSIAEQLEKRAYFRRTIKRAAEAAMSMGAKGIKVVLGGRLGGHEMSRKERCIMGALPLQSLREWIEYGFSEAHTTYGQIGVKVWVYRGEKTEEQNDAVDAKARQVQKRPAR